MSGRDEPLKSRNKRIRGFTLVEMITVITIIAVGCSIAVPNIGRMIQRNQLKAYVQTAQNAEDTLLALTGLQYANSDTGNPQVVDWPDPTTAPGRQYISIDQPADSIGGTFRVTVARSSGGRSEGQQEFFKRTMNDLPQSWKGADQPVCAAFFKSGGLSSDYVTYDFVYFEYYMTDDSQNLVIYHGAQMNGVLVQDPNMGWHIYAVNGTNYSHIGSL